MNKKGFTLIELLVAITIMGILIGLAAPAVDNLMARNKTRKYNAYARSMERAAKLYMDSYGENVMSSNENYFCIKLTYQTLKNRKLLKDYQGEETCEDDDTYVYVKKNTKMENDKGYDYDVSIRCKKNGNEVYREEATAPDTKCYNNIDRIGGITVSLDPDHFGWTRTVNARDITITVKDTNEENGVGFAPNTAIKYQWVKDGGTPSSTGWKTLEMGNSEQTSVLTKTMNNSLYPTETGEYRLWIFGICDTVGHCSMKQSFGLYKFDNTAPTCSVYAKTKDTTSYDNIDSKHSWANNVDYFKNNKYSRSAQEWTYRNVKASIFDRDDKHSGPSTNTTNEVSINDGYATRASNTTISRNGVTKVTYYLYDKVGNRGSCSANIKIDKERPTAPSIIMYKKGEQDIKKPDQDPGKGSYTGGWYKGWVYTTGTATTSAHNYSGTRYYTDGTGETDSEQKEQRFRNVDAEGISTVKYKACTKAGLCSDWRESTDIKLDRSAPTGMQLKKKIRTNCSNNWEGGDHDDATNYTSGSWTRYCTYSKAHDAKDKWGNGTVYSSYATGKTDHSTRDNQSWRNVNAEGTSTVYHRVCDNLGNCSAYTSYIAKLDHSAPTCKTTKSNQNTASGVTATFSCSDGGLSGVKKCTSQKSGLKTGTHSYSIEDNVGNSGTCSTTVYREQKQGSCKTYNTCKNKQCCGTKITTYLLNTGCSGRGESGDPECDPGYEKKNCRQVGAGACGCDCVKTEAKTCTKSCCGCQEYNYYYVYY